MLFTFIKQMILSGRSLQFPGIQLTLRQCYSKLGPTELKGRKTAAQKWLSRQLKDPYVKLARKESYRCRSAFKLLEIDEKYDLLRPGYVVVDCGAAPGSWSQVAVERANALGTESEKPRGQVISVDLQHMLPIDGATVLDGCDITSAETQQRIMQLVHGRGVDVVLSDMAPSATGVKSLDHDLIIKLAMSVLRLSLTILKEASEKDDNSATGTLLLKLWQGGQRDSVIHAMQKCFEDVRIVKPLASRADSAEIFLLARKFTLSRRTKDSNDSLDS